MKYISRQTAGYYFSSFTFGTVFTAFGPLIPYMAEEKQIPQSSFSFMFLCRALGIIISGIVFTKIIEKITIHHLIVITSFLILIASIYFTLTQKIFIQEIMILIVGFSLGSLEISVNMCISHLTAQYNKEGLYLLVWSMFGIGGFFGPQIVYMFQLSSFAIIGILSGLVSIPYLFIRSPQSRNQQQEKSNQKNIVSEKKQYLNSPKTIQLKLGFLLFLYLGIIVAFQGWIPSFAVIKDIATKESATKYNSIFWGIIAFGKIFYLYIPGTITQKIKICAFGNIIFASFSSFCCILNVYTYLPIITSIGFGWFLAPIYSFIVSITTQYKRQLSASQRANMMIFGYFGEACVGPSVGLLMQYVSLNMLFFSITILMITFLVLVYNTTQQLKHLMEDSSKDIDGIYQLM